MGCAADRQEFRQSLNDAQDERSNNDIRYLRLNTGRSLAEIISFDPEW
jgi:hypothetical protein